MVDRASLLTAEDRLLLLKVSRLLEGLIETLEIVEDEDFMKAIKEAEADVRAGRMRSYEELIDELRRSDEI